MSSSTKAEAFMFETEFSADGHVVGSGANSFKRYRQSEVDEMCETARQEGIASVEAETERRIAAAAEAIVQHLNPVLPFAVQLAEQMRREAGELAMLMARKVAGKALEHVPEESVEASLNETLSLLPNGFALVLTVHPDIAERIGEAITPRLPTGATLNVVPDPQTPAGAWSVTWDSGGFQHNPEDLMERLEELLKEHLNQPVDEQGDLFANIA